MEHVIDVRVLDARRVFERCFPSEVPVAPTAQTRITEDVNALTTTSTPRANLDQPSTSSAEDGNALRTTSTPRANLSVYRNPSGHYTVHGATAFAKLTTPAATCAVTSPVLGELRESSSLPAAPESHEAPHCYICLSAEGPLLVGVCSCRWMAVHTACLRKQYNASKDRTCRVCLKEMVQLEPHLWSDFPSSCAFSALGAACEMLAGLAVLAWMMVLEQQHGHWVPACVSGGVMVQHGWITLSTLMRICPGKLRCLFGTADRITCGGGAIVALFVLTMLVGLFIGATLDGDSASNSTAGAKGSDAIP